MELDVIAVRIEMAKKLITQKELAQKAGIAEETMTRYMNRKIKPSPRNIGKLAKALDIDVEKIIK